MKKLFVVLFVVLAACSSDDPQPKSYDSLLGEWKFTATGVSGNFVISTGVGSDQIIKSGSFKTNGNSHGIDVEVSISKDGAGPFTLSLTFIDDDGDNFSFTNATYSADFKEIYADGFFYSDGGSDVNQSEDVTITRKN